MKIVCVFPVRLSSQRLKRKHLIEVEGLSFLEWMVRRIQTQASVTLPDLRYAIATTEDPVDDPLETIGKSLGIEVYRGSRSNIPLRFSQLAHASGAHAIVCVDGDDITCSPRAVVEVAKNLSAGKKFVKTSGLPLGLNCMGFATQFLDQQLKGVDSETIETGWGRIFDERELLEINMPLPVQIEGPELRFTLDYAEDADFFTAIIKGVGGNEFIRATDRQIVDYVSRHRLNHLLENIDEKYWANYREQMNREKEV